MKLISGNIAIYLHTRTHTHTVMSLIYISRTAELCYLQSFVSSCNSIKIKIGFSADSVLLKSTESKPREFVLTGL